MVSETQDCYFYEVLLHGIIAIWIKFKLHYFYFNKFQIFIACVTLARAPPVGTYDPKLPIASSSVVFSTAQLDHSKSSSGSRASDYFILSLSYLYIPCSSFCIL